jgi:bifunctional non-homologous end joining protein LigD
MTKKLSTREKPAPIAFKFILPQLAELVSVPPVGPRWVHEVKLDGYRTQLHVRGGTPVLYSRRGLDWTHRFPEIAEASHTLPDCVIDGEVCAVGADGLPSFAGLTDALSAKKTAGLVYFVFDLMALYGSAWLDRPLLERKAALEKVLAKLKGERAHYFSYVEHRAGDGGEMHRAACKIGLEGIVSKVSDAPYKPDDRSGIWTKAKCRASQELVVGGWKTTGGAFRSLIVGAHRAGKFVHVGTVGTGFNTRNLPALMKALKARASDKSPFASGPRRKYGETINWTTPTLVIEAEIASWTSDGLVRQASFKGMREDKKAAAVVVETPGKTDA